MTGDNALALHLDATQDFKEISVVGLICYAAPTMGEALMELNRYARLAAEVDFPAEGGRFQLQPRYGARWLVDTRNDPQDFPETLMRHRLDRLCFVRSRRRIDRI